MVVLPISIIRTTGIPGNGNPGIVPPWLQNNDKPITIQPWPLPVVKK